MDSRLSQILAKISGEIRSPITTVLGISELQLQKTFLTVEAEKTFAQINHAARHLETIAGNITYLSDTAAGKARLVCKKYSVTDLISDASHLQYLGELKLNVDEDLPANFIGDAPRIKQILDNLLAFKSTGSIEMNVTGSSEEGLCFTVSNTGMPEESAGIGMSVVFSLVKLMNGSIDIENEPGKGATIRICIPQKVSGSELLGDILPQSGEYLKFVPEPSHGKVLVVDDLDANLYVAKGFMARYGLFVDTCDSGYEAVKKIKQGDTYDIIFLDHTMPGMTGSEVMKILREFGYTLPIVMLTANAVAGTAESYIEAGFDDFLSKPIKSKELDAVLMKHIPGGGKSDETASTGDNITEKLRREFFRTQKNTGESLKIALNEGNTESAQFLAHSLKGLAGLINETALVRLAEAAEFGLAKSGSIEPDVVSELENELRRVLDEIGEPEGSLYSKKMRSEIAEVLDELDASIKRYDIGSLVIVEKLRSIPEAAVLVRQVEALEYDDAAKTVRVLRDVLNK
ncbi:MAG: response regulator [Defluviitaleaceae bacterium]|nr:response regulator [Defluviitaleaceae bacterium]